MRILVRPSLVLLAVAASVFGCGSTRNDPADPYAGLPRAELSGPPSPVSPEDGIDPASDPSLAAGRNEWGLAYTGVSLVRIARDGSVTYGPQHVGMGMEPHVAADGSEVGFGIGWVGFDGKILFSHVSDGSETRIVSKAPDPSLPFTALVSVPNGWLIAGCVELAASRLVVASVDADGSTPIELVEVPMPDGASCGEIAMAAVGEVVWLAYAGAGAVWMQRLDGVAAMDAPIRITTPGAGAWLPHVLGDDHGFVLAYARGASWAIRRWDSEATPDVADTLVPIAGAFSSYEDTVSTTGAEWALLEDGVAVVWTPEDAEELRVQSFGFDGSPTTAPLAIVSGYSAHSTPAIARLDDQVGIAFRNSAEPSERIWFARVRGL